MTRGGRCEVGMLQEDLQHDAGRALRGGMLQEDLQHDMGRALRGKRRKPGGLRYKGGFVPYQ